MDQNALIEYTLHLADNALIIGHRNSEWTGHGPVLEQDIALSNIALDQIGQSRHFYQYAALLKGDDTTEDTLAYLRDTSDFRNCLMTELDKGDWGFTVLRQFFLSTWQYYLYTRLLQSTDQTLSAIAEKSLKEIAYHLRWSGEWVVRLGDGTEESHNRMQHALEKLWPYTAELFIPAAYEQNLLADNISIDPVNIKDNWNTHIQKVLNQATLCIPQEDKIQQGGKLGKHTEHLGDLLAEMQYLQRTYQGCEW